MWMYERNVHNWWLFLQKKNTQTHTHNNLPFRFIFFAVYRFCFAFSTFGAIRFISIFSVWILLLLYYTFKTWSARTPS